MQRDSEIHTFTTADADRLPLLHIILKESFEKATDGNLVIKHPVSKVLDFLYNIDFLDDICRNTSSSNLKAGQQFPEQALMTLCAASKNDRYADIVKAMLEAGTDINGVNDELMTPLHYAAMNGSIRVMHILLEHKASVSHVNIRHESSLLMACKHGQWEVARILFDNGADAFCSDADQCSPVSVAITSHAVELLQHMAAKNLTVLEELQRKVSLADAVVFGYDILTYDMQNLSNKEITSIVKLACAHGNTDIIQQFSKKLNDRALALYIQNAYSVNQFGCVNELLNQCKTRSDFPCPQISLSDSCKSDQLIDLTRLLIEYGKDVNEHCGLPLRTAVMKDNRKAVRYLIDNGADINKKDENITPLILACKENNLDVVDLLLLRGANINCSGDETSLTVCCQKGSVKVLKRLLSNEPAPDISIMNKDGTTALEIATGTCFTEIILHLMHKGEKSQSFEHVSFNHVCQVGKEDLAENFLQNCAACQSVEEASLDFVVKTNNLSLMKIVFSSDNVAKSSSDMMHAFKTACTIGSSEMVELFMECDSNITKRCREADGNENLHLAISRQREDIVRLLINNGYDPTDGHVPLHEAAKSKQVLRVLLECDLSHSDVNDALMQVCREDHENAESCAELLLDKAADVDYCDSHGLTPLLAATLNSSTAMVKLLLSKGANPNIADKNLRSPLFVACESGHHEITLMLLNNVGVGGKAHPYLQDLPLHKNALWVSCMNGYLDLVLLLLYSEKHDQTDHKYGQEIQDNLVQTVHDAGQHEVVRLLLENGMNPKALHNVDLSEACRLGYAEYVLSVYDKASTQALCECILEACNNGFEETALSIIINITDQTKKKQCLDIWEQRHYKQPNCNSSQCPKSEQKNPLWECFKIGDIESLKGLIAQGHNPNVQDNTGKSLLQACVQCKQLSVVEMLCNCPTIDINQKDSVGRNVLFYCLDCPPVRIEGRTLSLFDYLMEKGAEVMPDKFQRTVLHEWYPACEGSAQDLSVEKFKAHIPLDCKDHKGLTPLHLAAVKQKHFKARKLLEAGSNPHVKDDNDVSPFSLAERDLCMYKLFTEFHPDAKKTADDPKESQERRSAHFSKEYYMDQRMTHSLHTLFKQRYPLASSDIFRANFETSRQVSTDPKFKEEVKQFHQVVLEFMEDLSRVIAQDDPLFEFVPTLSGGCSEATKVIEMNKGVLCKFQHPTWKDLILTNHEEDSSFYMKLESEELAATHPTLFNKTHLSAHALLKQFHGLIQTHIAGVLSRHKNLYLIDVHTILSQDCTKCSLDLVWHGETFFWQEFSSDILPTIPVSTTQISGDLKHQDLVHDAVVIPKQIAGFIKEQDIAEAFQLEFSSTEEDLLCAMPIALKQGYELAKVLVHDCMLIDGIAAGHSISSYMLECQAFECFKTMPDFQKRVKASSARGLVSDELQSPEELMAYVEEIFRRLEQCMENHHLESFFWPGSNLLDHPTYRKDYRPLLHAKMCHAMLRSPFRQP